MAIFFGQVSRDCANLKDKLSPSNGRTSQLNDKGDTTASGGFMLYDPTHCYLDQKGRVQNIGIARPRKDTLQPLSSCVITVTVSTPRKSWS